MCFYKKRGSDIYSKSSYAHFTPPRFLYFSTVHSDNKKKSLKVINIHLLQARTIQSSWGRAAFPQIFAEVDLLLNDNDSEKKNIATKNKN